MWHRPELYREAEIHQASGDGFLKASSIIKLHYHWGQPHFQTGIFSFKAQENSFLGLNIDHQAVGLPIHRRTAGKVWCGTGRNWTDTSEILAGRRLPVRK